MTQDADNWQLLQDLFHLAEMTPEPDRERVLSERCTDDAVRQRAINIFKAWMLDAVMRGERQVLPLPTNILPDVQS